MNKTELHLQKWNLIVHKSIYLLGGNMEKGPFSLRWCAILEYEGVWSDGTINDPDDVSTSKLVENKGSTTTNGSCRIIRSFKYLKNKINENWWK